ncbi:MAG: 2-amino-4-hydroxy-6-hydroxymethyldihydropteridine diphosphokinase, partial [Pseudomonadota bacterium]|nr:2-amino-4-hydroxy-6-hydroxymethyldihydropteridine diphosphokinase [Pseudomonadota bacterium]
KACIAMGNIIPMKDKGLKLDLYLGIGSNLENPASQIDSSIQYLSDLDELEFIKIAPMYESKPMGPPDQPNYINTVALFKANIDPEVLLSEIKKIEEIMGRVSISTKWSERIIDIDIVLFGDIELETDQLKIPHPLAFEREFVIRPLLDLDSNIYIPGQGFAKDLIKNCKYKVFNRIIS